MSSQGSMGSGVPPREVSHAERVVETAALYAEHGIALPFDGSVFREATPAELAGASFTAFGVRVPYWVFKRIYGPVRLRCEDVASAPGTGATSAASCVPGEPK